MLFPKNFKVFAIILLFKITVIYAIGQIYTSEANNQYYIDFYGEYNWFESQIACLEMNMSLVEIKTSEKSLELKNLIEDIQNQNNIKNVSLWVGGFTTRYPNKHFVWLSTGEEVTYTNWYANNPNFHGKNEFCLQIVMERNLGWNDNPCINEYGFVCEVLQFSQIEKKLHDEYDKVIQLEENSKAVRNESTQLQQTIQDLKNSHQPLQEKLLKLKENYQNLQNELLEYENVEKMLSAQKTLNTQLQNQIEDLKNNVSIVTEENIRKEKEEQKRLDQKIKASVELQEKFHKLLDKTSD